MIRNLSATPYMKQLIEKHGFDDFRNIYFDENNQPLPDAPEELKKEIAEIRSQKRVRLP